MACSAFKAMHRAPFLRRLSARVATARKAHSHRPKSRPELIEAAEKARLSVLGELENSRRKFDPASSTQNDDDQATPQEKAEDSDDEFPVYEIKGRERPDIPALRPRKPRVYGPRRQGGPPRYLKMKPEQDWTGVWPAARSFNWSVVPFGVRQGFIPKEKLPGTRLVHDVILDKYANPELMKIPNFLHLTPLHVRKHCDLLKEHCTKWPSELSSREKCERYFPVTSITSDYVWSSASIREPKARKATLQVRLSALDLDVHGRDKILRLVGERYDKETDIITLTADRCPMKHQNYDYCQYLLAVLYKESCKTEPWEATITADDLTYYDWSLHKSRDNVVALVRHLLKIKKERNPSLSLPEELTSLPPDCTDEQITATGAIQNFKDTLTALYDDGESRDRIHAYKASVLNILGLKDVGLRRIESKKVRDAFRPEPFPPPKITTMYVVK